ncbi:MAG: metallophosphoesterase [Planctomycetota bacterium]|jgi:cytochrome c biogenesis protein CcdA
MTASRYLFLLLLILSLAAYGDDLSPAGDASNEFAVEPYLLDVTTDSATVAFHLNKPLSARVVVVDSDRVREFNSQGDSKSHFIRATGLKSGRTYDYQVICGEGEVRTPEDDDTFQIRTACREGESFTFAVYGDPRPGETMTTRYHREVVEQIMLHEPSFCLVLGDMVDDGQRAEQWQSFFRVESELLRSSAIYPVMGDNDYRSGKGIFAHFFPELAIGYYKFEWGGVRFFALNAWDTRGEQGRDQINAESPQIRWLESELSEAQVQGAPFRVVFLHDPVYISRGRSSEILRRIWAPIFQKYKVDVVFASWHLYERSVAEGITYVISGGGGAELIWMDKDPTYPAQAEARRHHFCRVDINSNAMTIRAIAADGTVLDAITLTPRSDSVASAERIERAAKRLCREILINRDDSRPEIPLYLFSYDCAYCRKLLNRELPALAAEKQVGLRVLYFDFSNEGTYDLFLNAAAEFGRQGADVPAVLVGRSVLGGESEIDAMLGKEMDDFIRNPMQYREKMIVPFMQTHDTAAIREQRFNALTYSVVFAAGLIDGVNPCAFTTLIFLISYLTLVGQTRWRMFFIGGLFTLAVFLTYLAIGLAFFNLVNLVLSKPIIAILVNLLLLLVVAALAGFSIVDFIRCLKGNVTDITLQLPKFLKGKIRDRIRDFSKNKIAMPAGAFGLGVVIAAMELACTGQVYIPIVTMIAEPRYRIAATFYLFSYNVAFIVPLVAVFLLATLGVTSQRMGEIFRRHVAGVKFALAVLFVAMAVMIIYNLRSL